MSFFEELKRRNVVRMAILYGIASWLILQIADLLFDRFDVPEFAFRLVLILLALGFPFALIFAWVFELTPEGLKREREVDRTQSITHETGRKINITIVALLVLAIAGMIADRLLPEQAGPPPVAVSEGQAPAQTPAQTSEQSPAQDLAIAPPKTGEDPLSIAVLPFVNMSGDPENEYFSDGLSEELLNTLVQIRELKVTGRTSSFAFKGQNLDLREVGERLNVANVLEGSVRKAANRVRITAQLIKTADGYHLWSETFDRELDDIFAIQAEIAEKVAQAMSVTLLGAGDETAGATHDTGAYEAYLRGAHILRRSPDDPESLEAARGYFEQSIALDPQYLAPRYGMFNYWDRVNRNGLIPFADSLTEMESQAATLEQLAPESVENLLAQARTSLLKHGWQKSLALHKKAHDRYPGSVETNLYYGSNLYFAGHLEEGLQTMAAGAALDPLSLEALVRRSFVSLQLAQCREVEQFAQRALEIEPEFGRVRGYMGYCLLIAGDDGAEALEWLSQEPVGFIRMSGKAIALHRLGRQEEAERELALLMEDAGASAAYQYAEIYAQWGDTPKALEWLRQAVDLRDPGALNMKVDHFLDPIRREAEFQAVLKEVGLDTCCELIE